MGDIVTIIVDLDQIRNKNERRIRERMFDLLEEYDFTPRAVDIEDVYAVALNKLPPRYSHNISLVFAEPVSDADIEKTLREAIELVIANPK